MNSLQRRQISAVFLGCLFTCCVAPYCFSCTQDDKGCGDHFGLPSSAATYCDGTCVKMRGEQTSNSVRLVMVTRMCIQQRDDGCYDTHWNGISVEACACNTDYCNSANQLVSTSRGWIVVLFQTTVVWLIHRLVKL